MWINISQFYSLEHFPYDLFKSNENSKRKLDRVKRIKIRKWINYPSGKCESKEQYHPIACTRKTRRGLTFQFHAMSCYRHGFFLSATGLSDRLHSFIRPVPLSLAVPHKVYFKEVCTKGWMKMYHTKYGYINCNRKC